MVFTGSNKNNICCLYLPKDVEFSKKMIEKFENFFFNGYDMGCSLQLINNHKLANEILKQGFRSNIDELYQAKSKNKNKFKNVLSCI